MVDIGQGQVGLVEAIADGFARKSGPVLDPAETLLFRGRDNLAVTNQASGRIAVECVDPEYRDHLGSLPTSPSRSAFARTLKALQCKDSATSLQYGGLHPLLDEHSGQHRLGNGPLPRVVQAGPAIENAAA